MKRNKVFEKLQKIFERVFCDKSIEIKEWTIHSSREDWRILEPSIAAEIEDSFDIKFSLDDIGKCKCIEDIVSKIFSKLCSIEYYRKKGMSVDEIQHSEYSTWNEVSPVQNRMYAINQNNPEGLDYNITLAFKIDGTFDYNHFESALEKSIDLNPMFNARFEELNGKLMYSIRENSYYNIDYVDLSEDMNDDFENFKNKEAVKFIKPYDLGEDTLYRIKTIKYSGSIFVVLVDFHHIIFDRGSSDVFFECVSKLYNCEPFELSAYNYNDYVMWQRKLVRSKYYEQEKQYWTELFRTPSSLCNMLVDHPKKKKSNNKSEHIKISVFNKQEVKALCDNLGCTKFTFWVSILNIVLSKLTYQNDITIGTVVSGRKIMGKHIDEFQQIVGMFVNTLPIRNRIDESLTIGEFIKQVQINNNNMLQNSDVQYDEINELCETKGNKRELFDIAVRYQKTSRNILNLENIKCMGEEINPLDCVFDLALLIDDCDKSFDITLSYSHEMYKKETIERIKELLIKCSKQAIENSAEFISEISLINSQEREQILRDFNNTEVEYPKDKTVVDLFEEQVEKTPDNIAVVFEDEKLTYAELNRKANQLARKLRNLGVKPDDFVAIMAERSIEMIVGIYGIIKAGGAYVPIDPAYPAERINYMLEDCAPKAVVVYKADVKTELPIINLGDNEIWEEVSANIDRVNKPSDLMYCIYTSGTTGKPKGVMVEHKGIPNLREYFIRAQSVKENDKILQFASFVFDAMVSEMTMSILNGGELHIINEDTKADTHLFEEYIEQNNISMVLLPPQYATQVNLKGVRGIITAGSESNRHIVEKNAKERRYSNDYGPTEVTVCATHWECTDVENIPTNIPIGKPISNTQIYILKEHSLCGVGAPGELCIAGDGIARGYLNRPELTKEKFVDNPYGEGRMYRSGDLARWLPDGNIEFLGRIDDQVKIRGFRIELGEIESELLKIDAVKDAVAVAKEDDNGDKVINAYIVSEEEISVGDIRNTLGNTLPEYMIPSYMMQIEMIPVTRNGKIDKIALPKIEAKSEREYVAPRNEIEEKVACVFEEILGVERVGVKDSFFEMGGHSLRATRTINRIEAETGVRLLLKTIFTNPTVEGLSNLVKSESSEEYRPIPKAEEKESYPMSSTQKRMYLINQMDRDGIAYNMPLNLRLRGEVSIEAIRDAVQKIINRHEILRTDFLMEEGELVQKIREHVKVDFEYVEDVVNTESELLSAFTKPFSLEKAPLLRVRLVKRKDHHLFQTDMHHIISDGMSMGTFIQEFGLLYNGEKLDALTHQYKDYSEWMRTRDISSQKEYWVNKFGDEIPVLDMPLDYARPQEHSFKGAFVFGVIEEDLSGKLRKLASRTGTTEYMVLLSALMVTLSKYTRQEDVVIGSPISGRTHKDTERMLGMFVNTLAMRGRPEGNKKYNEFLDEVKESCLKAYENQEYPFEELVEAVDVRRDMSRNPLFDVMLVLQNNEDAKFTLKDIDTEYVKNNGTIEKFDLTFNIYNQEGQLGIGLGYCTDLFKDESAQRILHHYIRVLEQIANNYESTINEIEVVTEEERALIIHTFNDTVAKYPKGKTVIELFEEQVEKTPDNIAVVFEDEKLTYAELNRKANQLARKLRKLGVKPDDFVAIIAERSIEMIVGIYGIIKAGGAYVPIDPTYPVERINYMIEDCAPKAVVVYKADAETELPVIDLGEHRAWEELSVNLDRVNKPSDRMYCIYTSGTTGKPKGVMVEHKSINNVIQWFVGKYKLNSETRVLQYTNYSFDPFVEQVFSSMLGGSSLFMIRNIHSLCIKELYEFICENQIQVINIVPSVLNELIMELDSRHVIRDVIVGGEKLPTKLKNDVLDKGIALHNHYGPTETAVDAITFDCIIGEYNPIGRPISNAHIYILNGEKLCGVGVPGELCIAGDGVARGYLNKPELTEEKFVGNPYEAGKMYRTGDLARWLPDGNIEYLGRIDDQVKIRGLRIELGEIESELLKIDVIKDAVAIAKEDDRGDKAINAYIVSDSEINISDIRNTLGNTLPEYMIPSYIMQIEKIPVTRNGKTDKRALPKIEAKSEREYIAPRNELEEKVAGVFAEIFKVEQVGVNDSFVEMGGHSLKAMRILSRIEIETGVRLPLKAMFTNPTVEELSNLVKAESGKEYVSVPKAEEKEFYDVSSGQKRMYILQQTNENGTNYNMPSVRILEGDLNIDRFKSAFESLVKRHDSLRTSFELKDESIVQRLHKNVNFNVAYSELGENNLDEKVRDFIKPFDLSSAPLMRAELVKLSQESHLLLFDIHHIISDGISMGILWNELFKLYKEEELPELKLQYKDFSEWQNKQIKLGAMKKQEEYWLELFKGEIPLLTMPTDYTRPMQRSFEGDSLSFDIGKESYNKLKKLMLETNSTMYMTLLSLFNILVSKYSNQEDIVIGSPIVGRAHEDLNGIIGVFINTIAMRNYPREDQTYKDFLAEVSKNALDAYDNQDYQFEELVEKLNIQRNMDRNPLFDIMFAFQDAVSQDEDIDGINIRRYNLDNKTSKFDMTMHAMEKEDGINLSIEYATKLFKRETIERLSQHFLTIIDEATKNYDVKLADLEMLSEEEKHQLLVEFNDTETEYPEDMTIHELFEAQAANNPDRIAVVYENRKLTYKELNEKANQLARRLRGEGVKPDTIVGLLLDRSIEMIIGILGVLKAGGAYLPIDTTSPSERIGFMLKDCDIKILLTNNEYVSNRHEDIVKIDLRDENLYMDNAANLKSINKPTDLAYVIFTSGSTGMPKGVLIEHINIVRLLFNDKNKFDFSNEDIWTMFHSYSFDFSVWEMYGALLYGGKLVVVPKDIAKDSNRFLELVKQEEVTVLNQVPAVFYNFANAELQHTSNDMKLRYVIFGGDALQPSKLKAFSVKYPNTKLINMYGITETTVHVTYKEITAAEIERGISNIGRPIPTLKIAICDENMNLLPIGVPGELCVSGVGVARGYLGREKLTKEKFVNHPIYKESRLYRSGDLARWLPNGDIEYLGRIDYQVKIRGFRIELAEIEKKLIEHVSIESAVVVAVEVEEQQQLEAYLSVNNNVELNEVIDFLMVSLPDYMIPSRFKVVDQIPLKSNGKVDRKRLLSVGEQLRNNTDDIKPQNEIQEILADIWKSVLKIDKISINDNFFYLGGNSLEVVILLSKIKERFDCSISISDFYINNSILSLASIVKDEKSSKSHADNPVDHLLLEEQSHYETSYSQKRLWVVNKRNPNSTAYNMSGRLVINERIDTTVIKESINEMAQRHEALRTHFVEQDGTVYQCINNDAITSIVEYDLSCMSHEEKNKEIDAIHLELAKSIFNIYSAPLAKFAVIKLSDDAFHLAYCMHHIISDGWSLKILESECKELIYSKIDNKAVELKPLKVQYKEYAKWESNRLNSMDFADNAKAYWMKVLDKPIVELNIPSDNNSRGLNNGGTNSFIVSITNEQKEMMKSIAKMCNTSLYSVILSTFYIWLFKLTNQKDIAIGTPTFGRGNLEFQSVMGCFVNTTLLRTTLSDEQIFLSFVDEVSRNLFKALEYQDYPLEMITKELNIPYPKIDVFFNMVDTSDSANTEMQDFKNYHVENVQESKFDLVWYVVEFENGLQIVCNYKTDKYSMEAIEYLMEKYEKLLSKILENSNLTINEYVKEKRRRKF